MITDNCLVVENQIFKKNSKFIVCYHILKFFLVAWQSLKKFNSCSIMLIPVPMPSILFTCLRFSFLFLMIPIVLLDFLFRNILHYPSRWYTLSDAVLEEMLPGVGLNCDMYFPCWIASMEKRNLGSFSLPLDLWVVNTILFKRIRYYLFEKAASDERAFVCSERF